jgi:hypothetical protein
MDVRIEPLSAESWPALVALFQQGGDPKWCWCNYWRIRSADWGDANAVVNRRRLRALVDRDLAPGLVALDADRQAVGWVSLGPREEFDRLEHSRVRPRLDDVPRLVDRLLRGRSGITPEGPGGPTAGGGRRARAGARGTGAGGLPGGSGCRQGDRGDTLLGHAVDLPAGRVPGGPGDRLAAGHRQPRDRQAGAVGLRPWGP